MERCCDDCPMASVCEELGYIAREKDVYSKIKPCPITTDYEPKLLSLDSGTNYVARLAGEEER